MLVSFEACAYCSALFPSGQFSRSIRLPLRVDPDKVEARAKNGILEIEMGRPDAERPRKIKVKAS